MVVAPASSVSVHPAARDVSSRAVNAPLAVDAPVDKAVSTAGFSASPPSFRAGTTFVANASDALPANSPSAAASAPSAPATASGAL